MNAGEVLLWSFFLAPVVWQLATVARRVSRTVSVRVARLIGPCGSCGWPVARGHRPDCTRP